MPANRARSIVEQIGGAMSVSEQTVHFLVARLQVQPFEAVGGTSPRIARFVTRQPDRPMGRDESLALLCRYCMKAMASWRRGRSE